MTAMARPPLREVLEALKQECVEATFFLVGRNVEAHPQLARREPWPRGTASAITRSPIRCCPACRWPKPKLKSTGASQRTSRRFTARAARNRSTPFFRFPGFAASPALLASLEERGIVVFGADLWASDWRPMSPDQELHLLLSRIQAVGRGIVFARHKGADGAHAAGFSARTEAARLPDRPRCTGRR